MIILEIDLGNSMLKWRLINDAALLADGKHPSNQQAIADMIQGIGQYHPERIRLASVGNKTIHQDLLESCIAQGWQRVEEAAVQKETAGVRVAYDRHTDLGIDRWLALLAARHHYPQQDVCILDCGSALTVDILDHSGQHLGGYISPGYDLMLDALYTGTNLKNNKWPIPPIQNADDLGINTKECLQYGAWLCVCAYSRFIVSRYSNRFVLVFTGGSSKLLMAALDLSHNNRIHHHPTLVLDGLHYALP